MQSTRYMIATATGLTRGLHWLRSFGATLLVVLVVGALPTTASAQYVDDETIELDNPDTDERFGGAIARIGMDGGDPVLVVGAKDAEGDATGRTRAGKAYLVNARDGSVLQTLNSPNETTQGDFGAAVSVVSDLTGDGFPEAVVGAPRENPSASPEENAGVAYVFDGVSGDLVATLQTNDQNIESGRLFGAAVAGVGDIVGGSSPEVLVGAPGQTDGGGNAGHVYVFDGDNLSGDPVAVLTGAGENGGNFGAALTPVGNLVGSGIEDFMVGAPGELSGGGQVYLVDGGTVGGTISSTIITSPNEGGQFGAAVDSVGASGDRDLIIGAPAEGGGSTSDGGRAYIFDGATQTVISTLVSPNAQESGGIATTSGDFGESVTGIEDVNGDGVSDVLIGAPGETTTAGNDREGRAYVFDGATGELLDQLESPNVTDGGEFGVALAGLPRPVVGAPQEDGSNITQAGRIYTFRIPQIAFVDGREGEAYDPSEASPGESNVPVGRFKFTTDDARSALSTVTVSNQGTSVSGVNSLELWTSANDVFDANEDVELASTTYSGTATFSGLDFSLSTGGTYIFLVVDLGSSPDGEYDPAIATEADIAITDGQIASVNGQDANTFSVGNGRGFLSLGPTAPLPVELAAFDADVTDDRTVQLQWQTTSETGNSGFRVQRSVSGTSWSTLGRVEGAGTTDEPQSYRFTDPSVPYASDSLQYRLAQVDVDGTVNFSDPVTVRFGNPDGLELLGSFPNPARSQATVRFAVPEQTTGDVHLALYDLLGRQVKTIPAAEASGRVEQTLDVSDLPSGTYLLRLSAGGQTQTQQVTIVR
jgi:hypothetical protein